MQDFNYIAQSIGMMQAVAVLVASVLIGLVLSAVQLSQSFDAQRAEAESLTQDVLALAEGGASNAAWTLDDVLAADVLTNVLTIRGVQSAEILDEEGRVLAQVQRSLPQAGRVASWIATHFLADNRRASRRLHVDEFGRQRVVGSLVVVLSPVHVAEDFLAQAVTTLTASLLEAFLIGLLLLWLSARLVTGPLRKAASTIAQIDPSRPDRMLVDVPSLHRANELGHLLEHTNDMLKRLANSQAKLRTLATRDSLTGLANRAMIMERLASALERARRGPGIVGLLFLDLDRFKNVNDALGHDVGDALLRDVAQRLLGTVRHIDTVGRLGGDEFLVVLEALHCAEEAVITANRILHALSCNIVLGRHEVRTQASIGISIFPSDGEDLVTLMRQADLAMYKAKESGGNCWHLFSKELSERMEARVRLEAALESALHRREFFLVFQPQVSARGGAIVGCEVLVRWLHEGKVLPASDFIELAEDTGQILGIGDWVLKQACRYLRHWGRLDSSLSIAVNVSARQIQEADFVERVVNALRRYGVEPGRLELEITESVLMADLDRSSKLLENLRREGVSIAIDDFGTGYSSLNYLARLPISALKVDRSFVSGASRSGVILHTIVAMAKSLRLTTVAEGVETQAQRELVSAEGCDQLQGYLLGAPVTAEEFERRLLGSPDADKLASAN